MFQAWRLKLREADEAFKQGRLDEANRLLTAGNLREFLPGQRLASKIADETLGRARRAAFEGDFAAAWKLFDNARRVGGETSELLEVQRELIQTAVQQSERLLQHGKSAAAVELLDILVRRGIADAEIRELQEVARRMQSASHLAVRGRLADAAGQIAAARQLRPAISSLVEMENEYNERAEQVAALVESLHDAMTNERWSEVAQSADRLLAIAAEHPVAREAQRRAWAKIGSPPQDASTLGRTVLWRPGGKASGPLPTVNGNDCKTAGKFMLWVDAVGGYLVCLAPEITIGQAVPNCHVDVPLQADISRVHVKICRAGEGYLLEALQKTKINGRLVQGTEGLRDGDEIQLADSVRLRFCKPHALSASARLEILSRHRTSPNTDGVLLMAESCVLGPNQANHIMCRQWSGDVVLYRQDDKMFCRAMESIEIDGQWCDGRATLQSNSRIVGSDFSLSLEAIA